jgi:hypothetical protein
MYEKYDGDMVYLDDDPPFSMVGHDRVFSIFLDAKVKGINGFLHILGLSWNPLLVRKLNDVGMHVGFSNKGCKMV